MRSSIEANHAMRVLDPFEKAGINGITWSQDIVVHAQNSPSRRIVDYVKPLIQSVDVVSFNVHQVVLVQKIWRLSLCIAPNDLNGSYSRTRSVMVNGNS
jgi:hypothetical protein